jgi:uncharacterized membrane protein
MRFQKHFIFLAVIVIFGLILRVAELYKSPLWYDEVMTLFTSTGHAVALPSSVQPRPEIGDFVQPEGLEPAKYFKQFSQFPLHNFSLGLVIRALSTSDNHPPVFNILMALWLKFFGISTVAERAFALLCNCLTFLPLWLLARRIGGANTAMFTIFIFSLNPFVVHYAIEARMYSLMMLLAVCFMCLLLKCHDSNFNLWRFIGLTLIAVIGMYTHYFFVCFLAGAWLWLLVRPGLSQRKTTLLHIALSLLLVLPWYAFQVPFTFNHDGIGQGIYCFQSIPFWYEVVYASRAFIALCGFVDHDVVGPMPKIVSVLRILLLLPLWAVVVRCYLPSRLYKISAFLVPVFAAILSSCEFATLENEPLIIGILVIMLFLDIWLYTKILKQVFSYDPECDHSLILVLYLTALSTIVGPMVADVLLHTRYMTQIRYCTLSIIPLSILLSIAFRQLSKRAQIALALALMCVWSVTIIIEIKSDQRIMGNISRVGIVVDAQNKDFTVISHEDNLVGMCLARELSDDRLMYNWYDGNPAIPRSMTKRVKSADEVIPLINGKPGTIFVRWQRSISKDENLPVENWLRSHAKLKETFICPKAEVLVFVPLTGDRFAF